MNKLKQFYESLPLKIKLFIGMLIAANTAALFTILACKFADLEVEYNQALAAFLIYRVFVFMANKQMPLTDENVSFMSSERTLWNLASFAVLLTMWGLISASWMVKHVITIIHMVI